MEDQDCFRSCVDEMYDLIPGEAIKCPERAVFRFGDICITRRQIKHIIEHRKSDGKSPEEIKQILDYVFKTVLGFDFEIENPNQEHPGSVLRVRVFKKWNRGMVLVLDVPQNSQGRGLITAYPYRLLSAYLLLLKKLRTSAAGKTPHP